MTFQCFNVNNMTEIQMIGGAKTIIEIHVFDESNGSPIDLTSATTVGWTLCYYADQTYSVLDKTGVVDSSENNVYRVTLNTADTINLSGKFLQQPYIADYAGQRFYPGQGIVTIYPSNVNAT